MTKVGAAENEAPACGLSSATYRPETGYTVVVDPQCLGNPSAVSYQVSLYYQTDPNNEDTVVTDVAPNTGLAGPVTRSGSRPAELASMRPAS